MDLPAEMADDGSYNFVFEKSGRLGFAPTEDGHGAVISLGRNAPSLSSQTLLSLLSAGGFEPYSNLTIHAGLAGQNTCVLATIVEEGELGVPELEQIFTLLRDRMQAIGL